MPLSWQIYLVSPVNVLLGNYLETGIRVVMLTRSEAKGQNDML